MNRRIFALATLVLSLTTVVCAQEDVDDRIPTREDQVNLSPDEVIKALKEGNARFVAGDIKTRDHTAEIELAASGQFPYAIVLSCVDSRVPVEIVFDLSIGDIFVARVAGNFENTDILGSMEYATAVVGSKVVLVVGHENCGAVKSAIDGAELGNITAMLENIQPAIERVSEFEGDKTSKNPEYAARVTKENVLVTIEDIRQRSKVMRDLEEQGKLKIIGAIYDMDTGKVEFLD